VYAWGENEYGQCGVQARQSESGTSILYGPTLVNFDDYYKPTIRQVSAGGHHSGFVDDIGRLFTCGKGDYGQLGIGQTTNEIVPYYVNRIPDKVVEASCGQDHTLVLT
jgi:alpha-tubulin suppressor-like RCC1 family protein